MRNKKTAEEKASAHYGGLGVFGPDYRNAYLTGYREALADLRPAIEALRYYANEENYDRWIQEDDKADGSPSCCSEIDNGDRARKALAALEGMFE